MGESVFCLSPAQLHDVLKTKVAFDTTRHCLYDHCTVIDNHNDSKPTYSII